MKPLRAARQRRRERTPGSQDVQHAVNGARRPAVFRPLQHEAPAHPRMGDVVACRLEGRPKAGGFGAGGRRSARERRTKSRHTQAIYAMQLGSSEACSCPCSRGVAGREIPGSSWVPGCCCVSSVVGGRARIHGSRVVDTCTTDPLKRASTELEGLRATPRRSRGWSAPVPPPHSTPLATHHEAGPLVRRQPFNGFALRQRVDCILGGHPQARLRHCHCCGWGQPHLRATHAPRQAVEA